MLIGKRNAWVLFSSLGVALLLAASLAAYALGPIATATPGARTPQLSMGIMTSVAWAASVTAQSPTLSAAAPAPDKPKPELCLGCHGPFDKLKARAAGYVTEQGEKVNPHVYVPHDSTKIIACSDCHESHPLPVTAPVKIAKANVQYCYSACHHMNDFTLCAQCHKEKK